MSLAICTCLSFIHKGQPAFNVVRPPISPQLCFFGTVLCFLGIYEVDVHCFLPCNALLQRVQYVMLCYVMEDNYLLSCAASFSAVCSFHNRSSTRFLITSIRMMHSSVVVTYNKVSLTGLRK